VPLQSELFRSDPRLQKCLVSDPDHVTPGAVGDHVHKIHVALILLDGYDIESSDILAQRYGLSTAAAVLAFKRKRNIVNRSYQTQADNIVGKMTIAALDTEMRQLERMRITVIDKIHCQVGQRSTSGV
jgi:hypothetical protein